MTDNIAFVLAGLPGCGKSTVADIIAGEATEYGLDAVHTEVSDFCRVLYEESHGSTSENDNDLGVWTATVKAEEGQDYFVRRMAEAHVESDNDVTIISGARSPEEAEAVREVFDKTVVIAIWTLPDIRFERKHGDVPSEEHPKWQSFKERNMREKFEWECVEFFTDMVLTDYILPNNGGIDQLEFIVGTIVREELGGGSKSAAVYQQSPFPDGMRYDVEKVSQYL